jgi:hypothetical protein
MPDVIGPGHASVDQLSALLDDRAESAELPFLTDHLTACDRCTDELQGLRAVRGLLRSLPVRLPPRDFTIPVQAPIHRVSRLVPITRVLSALAAVLCVILFSVDALGAAPQHAPPLASLTTEMRPDAGSRNTSGAGAQFQAAPTATAALAPAPPLQARPQQAAPATAAQPGLAATAVAPASAARAPASEAARSADKPAATAPPPPTTAPGRAAPAEAETAPWMTPLRAAWIGMGLLAVALLVGSFLVPRRRANALNGRQG